MLSAFWQNPSLMRSVSGIFSTLALIAFAGAGLYWLVHRPMFSIGFISVESESAIDAPATAALRHVNVASARAAALPRIINGAPLNFFTIDLDAVREAFESVAWVRRAQVSRVWPNRLLVRVEEHRVLGAWEEEKEGGTAQRRSRGSAPATKPLANTFVNTYGETFAVNPAEVEDDAGEDGLPELSGPAGREKEVVARYREFGAAFARLSLTPDRVSLSPRHAWSVHLQRTAAAAENRIDGQALAAGQAGHPGSREDSAARTAVEAAARLPDSGLTIELGRELDKNTLARRIERMIVSYPLVIAKWPKPTLIDLRYPNGFALRAPGLRLADGGAPDKPAVKKQHEQREQRQLRPAPRLRLRT